MIVDNRADLLSDFDLLRRRMDTAFGAFGGFIGGLDGQHGLVHHSRNLYPQLLVREIEGGWEVTADVPGFRAEEVSITVEGRDLRVQGKAEDTTPEGWRRTFSERRRWSFDKTLRFAELIDSAAVGAEVKNGVLRVTLPRAKAAGPVRIEVKS